MIMKAIIPTLFFSVMCGYSAISQTVSSQKKAEIKEVTTPATPVPASQTATLVSGSRQAVITEVPVENKPESKEVKTEPVSSQRKPE